MAKISSFIDKIGEGVKPNMFMVKIPFPDISGANTGNAGVKGGEDEDVNLLCKSAALPASNLGVIEVPFRGRTVKISGDRTFDTWSATFFNDKSMKLRGMFEAWLETMNTHETNNAPFFRPSTNDGYMRDIIVQQMRKDTKSGVGNDVTVLREYELKYAFPTSISQIDLAYDSNDQIEEFTVEFQYSYWHAKNGGDAFKATVLQ